MSESRGALRQRVYQEFKEFLILAFYLWVVFGLLLLYKSVVLNNEHVSTLAKGLALINALALGKVMLVARALRLGDWFADAPLIYPTLVKSALFSVVLALFKVLEEVAVGIYHHRTFQASIADLAGGTLAAILTVTFLLFVMLIPFVGATELQRVLGEGRLSGSFFHSRPAENR